MPVIKQEASFAADPDRYVLDLGLSEDVVLEAVTLTIVTTAGTSPEFSVAICRADLQNDEAYDVDLITDIGPSSLAVGRRVGWTADATYVLGARVDNIAVIARDFNGGVARVALRVRPTATKPLGPGLVEV